MNPATSFTAEVNRDARDRYAMEDVADFDDVNRGLIIGFADGWRSVARLLLQPGSATEIIASGAVATDGDTSALETLASVMDAFDTRFNIATP